MSSVKKQIPKDTIADLLKTVLRGFVSLGNYKGQVGPVFHLVNLLNKYGNGNSLGTNRWWNKDVLLWLLSIELNMKLMSVLDKEDALSKFLKSTDELDEFVKSMTDVLLMLPSEYKFVFRMPRFRFAIEQPIVLSENVEIIPVNDVFLEKYFGGGKKRSGALDEIKDRILYPHRNSFEVGDVVLIVTIVGAVRYGSFLNLSIPDPLYVWRVIMGVYVGFGAVKEEGVVVDPSSFSYDVYRVSGPLVYYDKTMFGDSRDYVCVRGGIFVDENKFYEASSVLKYLLNSSWRNESLGRGGNRKEDFIGKHKTRLRIAAFWLYESKGTKYKYIQAVYATAAFDALLGFEKQGERRRVESFIKAKIVALLTSSDLLELHMNEEMVRSLYMTRNGVVHGDEELMDMKFLDVSRTSFHESHATRVVYSIELLTMFFRYQLLLFKRTMDKFRGKVK